MGDDLNHVISMIIKSTADRPSFGLEDRLATLIAVSKCQMPEQLFGLKDRIFANAGNDIIQGASNDYNSGIYWG